MKIKIIAGEAGGAKAKIEKSVPLSYFHVHIPPRKYFECENNLRIILN